MTDERFLIASQLSDNIRAKAEELSTAFYEAKKMGYRVSIRLDNVVEIESCRFLGDSEHCPTIRATVAFDIGQAVL